MSKLRSVSTGFWSDPFIEELDSEEKLLFLYLITNEKTNMLGIYEASLKKISFETGLSFERVRKALERFETLRKVKYSNNYVFVLNYMKHQKYNSNMKKSAMAVYSELPEHMKIKGFDYDKINPLKGFESLLKHLGMVSKIEIEIEEEIEYEIKEEEEIEFKGKFLKFYDDKYIQSVIDLLEIKNIKIDFETIKKDADIFVKERIVATDTNKDFFEYADHFRNIITKKYSNNQKIAKDECEADINYKPNRPIIH